MTIEAKIVCDSVGPNDIRITTFVLKYPRFIHSEFMTHRAFSRNASSSRAIPFEKQVKLIEEDMASPLEFRKNQKGMQAGAALSEEDQEKARTAWRLAGLDAIENAEYLAELGVHKQYVNRILEPYAHISVVCTATEFANFFALRHHSMAQPEIAELAKQMWEIYSTATPQLLQAGEWHLPFITLEDVQSATGQLQTYGGWSTVVAWDHLIKLSVARCARVSYLTHEGRVPDRDEDLVLYNRLLKDQPIHASPAEHQAKAEGGTPTKWGVPFYERAWSGNFKGWTQYRKTLEGENITNFTGPIG